MPISGWNRWTKKKWCSDHVMARPKHFLVVIREALQRMMGLVKMKVKIMARFQKASTMKMRRTVRKIHSLSRIVEQTWAKLATSRRSKDTVGGKERAEQGKTKILTANWGR